MANKFSRLLSRFQNLWDSQIDHAKIDKQIQEMRLKYEFYRTRL